MPNTIDDLRDHLFATMAALRDKDNPMDVERAKAVADVARVVIDSAKVEVKAMEVAGGNLSSSFLPAPPANSPEPGTGAAPRPLRQIQRGLVK